MVYEYTNPQRLPLNNNYVALTRPTLPTSKDYFKTFESKKTKYIEYTIYQIK